MNFLRKIKYYLFVKTRILKYQFLSDNNTIGERPIKVAPVLFSGKGKIHLGTNVQFGYHQSANFYSHYSYLEARTTQAEIIFGNNIIINNACNIVAIEKITIGDNCIIGLNFSVLDSNFHHLEPHKRHDKNPPSNPVKIGNNVFIGNNVTILKGVEIGNNVVIGNNSVVTKSFPENTVISGNPAQIIKTI